MTSTTQLLLVSVDVRDSTWGRPARAWSVDAPPELVCILIWHRIWFARFLTGEHEATTFHIKAIGLCDQELVFPFTFDVGQDTIGIASWEFLGAEGINVLRNEKVVLL